ncbi:helix-turn-helix domain-containing protein [Sporobacter termitidis]|uniref:helix-turn-helix domain-containing protein n=1 Tax=Sporobacter termitidis TaxID=44749 RepID=UPI000934880D
MSIMLTVAEAATQSHMSPGAIRRLCAEGKLRHVKVGVKVLINERIFNEFLEGTIESAPETTGPVCGIRRLVNGAE